MASTTNHNDAARAGDPAGPENPPGGAPAGFAADLSAPQGGASPGKVPRGVEAAVPGRAPGAAPDRAGAPPSEVSGVAPSRPAPRRGRTTRTLWAVTGAVFLIVVWQVLSLLVDPVFVASPAATVGALARLAWGSTLWVQLLITLMRLVVGLAIGAALGLVFGVLAGLDSRVRSFFEPLRWVGMTIPVVIIVVLTAFWFGMGHFTVMLAVALIVMPTVYINTVAGILAVDNRLVEMGRVYRFSRRLMLTEVYAPGIASPVMAGLTLATGIGVRAVVLMEVMMALSGIGHAFTRAWVNLETPDMFAWVIVVLALMALIEFGVLRPLRRRVMRWRKVAQ